MAELNRIKLTHEDQDFLGEITDRVIVTVDLRPESGHTALVVSVDESDTVLPVQFITKRHADPDREADCVWLNLIQVEDLRDQLSAVLDELRSEDEPDEKPEPLPLHSFGALHELHPLTPASEPTTVNIQKLTTQKLVIQL